MRQYGSVMAAVAWLLLFAAQVSGAHAHNVSPVHSGDDGRRGVEFVSGLSHSVVDHAQSHTEHASTESATATPSPSEGGFDLSKHELHSTDVDVVESLAVTPDLPKLFMAPWLTPAPSSEHQEAAPIAVDAGSAIFPSRVYTRPLLRAPPTPA